MRRTLVVLGASITGLMVLFVIDLVTPRDVVVASLYVPRSFWLPPCFPSAHGRSRHTWPMPTPNSASNRKSR